MSHPCEESINLAYKDIMIPGGALTFIFATSVKGVPDLVQVLNEGFSENVRLYVHSINAHS